MAKSNVIDLTAARKARINPFKGELLAPVASRAPRNSLALLRKAIRRGIAGQQTTQSIVAQIIRDQVRQKARAAL